MRFLKSVLIGPALGLVLVTSASITSRAAQKSQGSTSEIQAALDAFDRCVQQRFVNTVPGFGLARMVTMEVMARPAHSTLHFSPASDAEHTAVQRFEALGLRVVMFLAGLQRPRLTPSGATVVPASALDGPVMVHPTGNGGATDAADLLVSARLGQEANESFEAFGEADSRSFAIGEWKFVAHPVRAPEGRRCLGCHNARPTPGSASPVADASSKELFKPGDAIGVLLYGYQPMSAR